MLEYSDNYSVRSGSLLNYFISGIDDVDDNTLNGCSFHCKTIIMGKTPSQPLQPGNPDDADQSAQPPVPTLNVEAIIPIKYLKYFCWPLGLPLINCRVLFIAEKILYMDRN